MPVPSLPNRLSPLRVLFAAAEAAPIARVGGLAEAAGGLIRVLRARDDVQVDVVLPDYGGIELKNEELRSIDLPHWATPASMRVGEAAELGEVMLVDVPGMAKPHPYLDDDGIGWPDNTERFFAFSAAVAALASELEPDVVHLNDWHTALALAWIDLPTVYTIHTLGYQGEADIRWLSQVNTDRGAAFDRYGVLNPAAGALRLADRVVAVSPNYALEILDPARSAGLHTVLAARGEALVGILNGIDDEFWNPATDEALPEPFSIRNLAAKETSRAELIGSCGWSPSKGPIIGMVTRLVDQKGIDIALGLVPYLERMGARLILLGSGEERLTLWAHDLATRFPNELGFFDAYDVELAHRIFAGSDLFLMPSRFEPCGLAQMQAMAYGTIPVVTAVGGLVDTVIDFDEQPGMGNGFVALTVDGAGVLDALHRALRGWADPESRLVLQTRGMTADWSWRDPAGKYVDLYEKLAPGDGVSAPRDGVSPPRDGVSPLGEISG